MNLTIKKVTCQNTDIHTEKIFVACIEDRGLIYII